VSRWPSAVELGGAAIAAALAIAGSILGLAQLPALWSILAITIFTLFGFFLTRATRRRTNDSTRDLSLTFCVVLLGVFITGSAVYNRWFDPSKSQEVFTMVVNGTEVQGVFPFR
jgi:hypothetical protein